MMSASLYQCQQPSCSQRLCGRRGILCERWTQTLAIERQGALYNVSFYFPVLDVCPPPCCGLCSCLPASRLL